VAESVLAEFQRLYNQREMAAYRMVGAVQAVVRFFEAQEFDLAEDSLREALAVYEAADRRITQFWNTHKGEFHGNSTAA